MLKHPISKNKSINKDLPTYIIAETSANHCGDFDKAIKIIRKEKRCGADAVKIQTFRGDTITLNSDQDNFLIPETSPWREHMTLFSLVEGETCIEKNIKSVRPTYGLHPKYFETLLGKKAIKNILKGDRISWNLVDLRQV
jgi:sialic acid synthase SpsE